MYDVVAKSALGSPSDTDLIGCIVSIMSDSGFFLNINPFIKMFRYLVSVVINLNRRFFFIPNSFISLLI